MTPRLDIRRRRAWPSALRAAALLVLLPLGPAPRAQDPEASEPPPLAEEEALAPTGIRMGVDPLEEQRIATALAGLEERVDMLGTMILDAARAYRAAAIARSAAMQELIDATARLDREAVRPAELTVERLESLLEDRDEPLARVVAAERAAAARLDDLRRLLVERQALNVRIAALRSRLPGERENLTGVWQVNWLPAGIQGTFYLDQSGTLVTGQYRLGPVGHGSLQGTYVGGKLLLQRIDAERGRDAELQGVVDADGRRIRGSWQAYELVGGGLPSGEWVAQRVD